MQGAAPRASGLVTWAAGRLAERGWTPAGPPDPVRERPWATVVRLPTDHGPVWAKAAAAEFGAEIALLGLLARHAPGATPPVLALDPAGYRALLADGGPTLDATGTPSVAAWTAMLRRYAATQLALAPHLPELLAAGLPDLRPEPSAAAFAELVDRPGLLRVGGEHGVSAAEASAVRRLVPRAARAARRLSGSPVPPSVQHDDLQPANVVPGGALVDWGDACVAHPFASLLTALTGSAARPAAEHHGAIRDAYLTAFVTPDGPGLPELREQARLAVLLAPVGRILAWLRVPESLDRHPDAITSWWRRILADPGWERLR